MSSKDQATERLDKNLIEQSLEDDTSTQKLPKFVPVFILMYTALQWTSVSIFYEFPILFEDALIKEFGITPVEIGYFMGATYTIPLFFQVKIGNIIDRLGQFKSNIAIQSLMLFSILLAYLGVLSNSFWLMCISRALYGVCFNSLFIVISSLGSSWATSWITLFLGLNRSIANFFLSIFNFFQPLLYLRYESLVPPLLLYSLVTVTSIVLSFIYLKVEKKYYKFMNMDKKSKEKNKEDQDHRDEEKEKTEGAATFGFRDLPKIRLISKVVGVTMTFVPFCHRLFRLTAIDLIMVKFNKTYSEAKNPLAIYPFTNLFLLTSFSFIFAAIGKKSFGMLTASVGYLACYLILLLGSAGVPNWMIYLAFVILSFSASCYRCCAWACLILTLPKQANTTVTSFLVQLDAIFITFLPILIGFVTKDRTPQAYDNQLWMFISLAGVLVLVFVWVCVYDLVYCDGMLTKIDSHKDVKEYKERVDSEMDKYLKRNAGLNLQGDVMELHELDGD